MMALTSVVIISLLLSSSASVDDSGAPKATQLTEMLNALRKASSVTLFSLDPSAGRIKKDGYFDYKILGKLEVGEDSLKTLRPKLVEAFSNDRSKSKPCFLPRHGLSVDFNKVRFDILICFECNRAVLFIDGNGCGLMAIQADSKELINKLLRDGKVPLAKQPEDK